MNISEKQHEFKPTRHDAKFHSHKSKTRSYRRFGIKVLSEKLTADNEKELAIGICNMEEPPESMKVPLTHQAKQVTD